MTKLKIAACIGMASVMLALTAFTADAAYKRTWDNKGNSCPYKGSIDISLGWYGIKGESLGTVYSDHRVSYSKPEVTMQPYNNQTDLNAVIYYAEWKEGSVIKDKIEKTYIIKNNDVVYRDLSDGMKLTTWDSDITYFRTDIYPYIKKSTLNRVFKEEYKRRASTDITH